MPLTLEQKATLEETSYLSALAFVDTPLYKTLVEGDRQQRLDKLTKYFKIRHTIMMCRDIQFFYKRDGQKLVAFAFCTPLSKQFSTFDIWYHFIFKLFLLVSISEIRGFLNFA